MLNKVDINTLGHKNSIPLEPYLKCVRTRAQSLMMPYPSILPVIIEPFMEGDVPYTILHPDMPTSLEDLQRDWIQLKGERDDFEAQFYTSEKKVLELTKQLHEEWSLNAYIAPKRMRTTFYLRVLYYFSQGALMYSNSTLYNVCSFLSKANLNL